MVEPKPTTLPIWNTGGLNRTDPGASKKALGWVLSEEPPSSWFNWLQHYTGAWFVWIDERMSDGANEEDLNIRALVPDTTGDGGSLNLDAGDANTTGDGGNANLNAGDAVGTGIGGFARVNGGDGVSGTGGDVRITGGAATSAKGGDIVLTAGVGDTGGGYCEVNAANAGTSGAGGYVQLQAGDSIGTTGGNVTIEAGASDANGGSVDIDAGSTTSSGAGGAVTINAGDSVGTAGGAVTITSGGSDNTAGTAQLVGADGTAQGGAARLVSGSSTSTGNAGNATVQAGDSIGNPGGDVNILAGGGDTSGGAVQCIGGSPTGTDLPGGTARLRSGDGTGTGGGSVDIQVSEAAAGSGSTPNPALGNTYIQCLGTTGNKAVRVNRYLRVENVGDTTRGEMRFIAKAQPSAPSSGDVYFDSSTDQVAIYNGTQYQNLNPTVYNSTQQAVSGYTPPSPSTSTDYALQELAYGSSPPLAGTEPAMRYIIPANTLRVGSIVRVRAEFRLIQVGSDYADPRIYVGSVGSGTPYSSPAGALLLSDNRSTAFWSECSVVAEMRVRSLGATATVDRGHSAIWPGSTAVADVASANETIDSGAITVDTTSALDVFPGARYRTVTTHAIQCERFIVEIL